MTPTTILETIIKYTARRVVQRTAAMAGLSACADGAFVTVAEFKAARAELSTGMDDAYTAARNAADPQYKVDGLAYVSGLVSLAALHKRRGTDEAIPAEVRTVLAAAAALKALIEGAKDKASTGRRPAVTDAPVKARVLDMGTCAFCRRLQSVRGTMVDHGYTDSRYGFRAGSCGGTNTKPIETSPDGLHALLRALESAKERAMELIDTPPTAHTVNVRNGIRLTPTVFTSGPEFDRAARRVLAEARGTVALAGERIPEVAAEIAAWAPGKLVTAAEATARGV
ncbi:MAG: hypothetical protein RLZZ373_3195 [Pseudomonadota bacterium]|jgi:hypothetical protein